MRYPEIKTVLPGPEASRLIRVDRTYVSPSYTRAYPLVVKEAKGLWIRDVDDNLFLDFTSGIAVCATGHCQPLVVQAIKDQAARARCLPWNIMVSRRTSWPSPRALLRGCL